MLAVNMCILRPLIGECAVAAVAACKQAMVCIGGHGRVWAKINMGEVGHRFIKAFIDKVLSTMACFGCHR
jgi:hypothetical protein